MRERKNKGLGGSIRLRRKLRKMPGLLDKHLAPRVENVAKAIQADMIKLTPKDTGALRAGIDYKMSRDKVSAVIGPGASGIARVKRYRKNFTKFGINLSTGRAATEGLRSRVAAVTDLFYFRFLDMGTKGAPKKNIPPQPALHIRQRSIDANQAYARNQSLRAFEDMMREIDLGNIR